MNKRELGEGIEQKVKFHLMKKKFNFLDENWSCRYGELDLVFEYKRRIIFVEVKYRGREVIFPEEILNTHKLNAQVKTIYQYLQKNNLENKMWQLDYALVTKSGQRLLLQYFPQVPLEVE